MKKGRSRCLACFILCIAFSIMLTSTAYGQKNYLQGSFHGTIWTSMLKDNAVLTPDGNLRIEIDENKTIRYIKSKYDVTIVQKTDGARFIIQSNGKKAPVALKAKDLSIDGDMDISSTENHAVQADNIDIQTNSHISIRSPKNCLRADQEIAIRGRVDAETSKSYEALYSVKNVIVSETGDLRAIVTNYKNDAVYAKKGYIKVKKGGKINVQGKRGLNAPKDVVEIKGTGLVYGKNASAINSGAAVKIDSSDIKITSTKGYGIWANGHIQFSSGKGKIKGKKGGIWSDYGLVQFLKNGSYSFEGSDGIGIRAYQGINFMNGTITSKGSSKAVYTKTGSIRIWKSHKIVDPKGGKVKGKTIVSSNGKDAKQVKIAEPTSTTASTPYKVGTLLYDKKGNTYKVTSAASGNLTASFVKPYKGVKGAVRIPDYITARGNRYLLTLIEPRAFKNNKDITKVTLGENVESIGVEAFSGCTGLQTVNTNKALARIGTNAFYNCKKLSSFTIPAKVYRIGSSAFQNCTGLKTLIIKSRLLTSKELYANAFKGTYEKISVTVPAGMTATYRRYLQAKGLSKKATFKEE